jgi:hypothetical protein
MELSIGITERQREITRLKILQEQVTHTPHTTHTTSRIMLTPHTHHTTVPYHIVLRLGAEWSIIEPSSLHHHLLSLSLSHTHTHTHTHTLSSFFLSISCPSSLHSLPSLPFLSCCIPGGPRGCARQHQRGERVLSSLCVLLCDSALHRLLMARLCCTEH